MPHFSGVRLTVAPSFFVLCSSSFLSSLFSARDRCAANEQWRFQCDDRRRIAKKTALNRRKEDGRERAEDEGVRWVTLHDATLTISNDQSPYFHSSPFPLPVAVPGACRLARIPAMGAQARLNNVAHIFTLIRQLLRNTKQQE
ncbi:hypothetical protein T06_15638 [Trichinella sp. T6]|nr:hypothetical protein T06_15638 [Trichinella sp. T6]